jgi:sugar phosphate isomerase/epimerase
LADFGDGQFTDFEGDKEKALKMLKERGFASIEFIPTRNTAKVLEEYSQFFWDNGFVVTFGTEHNSPAMEPIEVHVEKNKKLSSTMVEMNYKGACIVAAHQHLVAQGKKGYVDENGVADIANRDEYVKMGDEVIRKTIEND